MARDEDYLEGLREEDHRKAVAQARANWVEGIGHPDDWGATEQNWENITPQTEPHPRGAGGQRTFRYTSRLLGNERDYLQGMSSLELAPDIKPNNKNVSQQLVEHVNALSSLSARRPPKDYAVYSRNNHYGDYSARLIHTPTQTEVGSAVWSGHDGHVAWLGVDEGHRHMTNYLVSQAWNDARIKGHYGPSASDSLTPFSERVMRRHNPGAQEYKQFLSRGGNSEPCAVCRGDGVVPIYPHSSDNGETVHYRYSDGSRFPWGGSRPNTTEGKSASRDFLGRGVGGEEIYGKDILNERTGDSHHWFARNIQCDRCNGTGNLDRQY